MDEKNEIIEEKKEYSDYWLNINKIIANRMLEGIRKQLMEEAK